ncbi:VOC family protein [Lyngbya sp. CCY1209]|jgi:catechol 2,3-dioxygenase-like lactoylglutathione lyase family enzyme|uniref:VOC family protein n=1 Tax=Lyngbya sp. CCY1209 TaxID=2886103 RepID=UPI002D1FE571|nr:VOC family protein [Lyngbya sp. CCY1209]MEB3886084.1 VOC family protein [Lyngbya sp. CCY1209]
MAITEFLHAAILVSDLEKSQRFYGQILGLNQVDRPLQFPGIWYQSGNFQIHLIQAQEVVGDRVNEDKWGRNRHLAFSVSNLEFYQKILTENNCKYQMSSSGRSALFIEDPDGNIIELNQQ